MPARLCFNLLDFYFSKVVSRQRKSCTAQASPHLSSMAFVTLSPNTASQVTARPCEFISIFTASNKHSCLHEQHVRPYCPGRGRVHMALGRRHNNNNKANNDNDNGSDSSSENMNFEPFDGSRPLLPPWRPEFQSLEEQFTYTSSKLNKRVKHRKPDDTLDNLVKIQHLASHKTLFASVISTSSTHEHRILLRPLLLDIHDGGFVDLRGTNDVLLNAEQLLVDKDVDAVTRTKLRVNLAATEPDALQRFVSDENGVMSDIASNALLDFLSSCHNNKNSNNGD